MPVVLHPLSPHHFRARLSDALTVYTQAMGYDHSWAERRRPSWSEAPDRPGWGSWGAFVVPYTTTAVQPLSHTLVGIIYGHEGDPLSWWSEAICTGLVTHGGLTRRAAELVMTNYFELAELHVAPEYQGRGIGSSLVEALLSDRTSDRVILTTPESPADTPAPAVLFYQALGFQKVLDNFYFQGDQRPFSVMVKERYSLPLAQRGPSGRPRHQ